MTTMLFINLPVRDLRKSMDFFSDLGFHFNAQFTNDRAAAMIINDDAYVMLVSNEYFQTFTPKKISDATKTSEALVSISADSREMVDDLVRRAIKKGGTLYHDPVDQNMMYQHGFQDLDGHIWEVVWMDPNAIRPVEYVVHKSERERERK